jgi:hypothetical protein
VSESADVLAFSAFAEVPESDVERLEVDDTFVLVEFVDPIGVVEDLRVFRYGGTIVDSSSPAVGSPGECVLVLNPDGGKGNCRTVPPDADGDPWFVFRELVGAPIVAWSGLADDVVAVRVTHEDGSVSVQAPRGGFAVFPIEPNEEIAAVAERANGETVPLAP